MADSYPYPKSDPPPMYTPAGLQPPPSGLPQPHHQHQHQQPIPGHTVTHVINSSSPSPVIIYTNSSPNFGPYPMRYTCPECNAHIMTEIHSKPGLLTYILSGTLLILAWYVCCCFAPFYIRECQDIEHKCPNCNAKLGLYKRF